MSCNFIDVRVEAAILKSAADVESVKPGQEHKAVNKVKQKARTVLQEMVANISPAFIRYWCHFVYIHRTIILVCVLLYNLLFYPIWFRLTGWVLLRLFNGFFWSIQIHKGQLEMVKKAATEVRSSKTDDIRLLMDITFIFMVIS